MWIPNKDNVEFEDALEIIKYCLYDGKVDQGSKFETDLFKSLVEQFIEIVSPVIPLSNFNLFSVQ